MNRFRWAALVAAGMVLIASCATSGGGGGGVGGGNQSPNAVATADVTSGSAPLTVHFTGSLSSDPDGAVTSFAWNFGDGGTSTAANTSHTYAAVGPYTASLLVTDNSGATDLATIAIEVGSVPNLPPVAVAGATPNPVKQGKTVTFSSAGSGDSDGTITTYEWDFGDNSATSNAQNPTHVYATAGPKVASLKVTDDDGAVNTATVTITVNPNQAPTAVAGATPNPVKVGKPVSFSSAGSSDDGTIVSYSWSMSDGFTSTAQSPSHTFSTTGAKTATLTVTDDNGVTGTATVNVTVNPNQAPTAVANATPSSGQTPLTVQFNSSALSNDPDGTIVSRSWNFGGGNTSTAADPSFIFTAVGTHTVTLTVTDDDGAIGTDQITVTVSPIPNLPPVAHAAGTPTSGKEDLTVAFSSAGSSDPEGGTLTYAWTFGDGGTSASANPSYTYLTPGDYVATLTVTDPGNGQASATVAIHVTPNAVPNAVASANPLTIRPNLLVSFSSASSTDDGTIVSRSWNFGDSTTSTAANPTHGFTTTGTKTVTLTVTDDNGATDTDTVTITVVANGTPVAVANATPQSGASPLVVAFNGSSSTDPEGLPLTYLWNFGDGSATVNTANTSHTYAVGTWTATLTVTDDFGATNSATVSITAGAAVLDAPTSPVVMTGADLPALVGTAPNNIVAFKFNVVGGSPVWTQVPVQVDQRKVVPFGYYPNANDLSGTTGTVYGEASGGAPASLAAEASQTALQYADANTFVGADTDTNFDADDELVFMAFDSGNQVQGANPGQPAGVVAGTGLAVRVDETRSDGGTGWVYLFKSTTLNPAAGKDYVTYTFSLTSGNYKTTYKRWWQSSAQGTAGNPETSQVTTPTYKSKFTDRWKETDWQVLASGASGADILDVAGKVQISPSDCATRNNKTLSEGEGAFVANIDGPVRAIRSYVGANSGPNTQHTHFMYRDREDVVFDLRVHSLPSLMDFVEYNSAASGMTYRSSTVPGGVTINGAADTMPTTFPTWEAVNGSQGTVINTMSLSTSVTLGGTIDSYYRDAAPVAVPAGCWDDGTFFQSAGTGSSYGASGMFLNSGVPDTDPAYTNPPASVKWVRSTSFGSPVADPSTIPAKADDFQKDVANPFVKTVSPYTG